MTDAELQAEQLTVLPQRLETIFIGSGPVHQSSNIHQSNFSSQVGGDCFHAGCNQFNSQSNVANVHQHVSQGFRFHGHHHGW
jgi:hypothetical protein